MLERLIKEIKRRIKVIEVFWDEGSLEKVVYLVVRELEERYQGKTLIGFKEAEEELEALRRQKYGKINRHN
jgi:transposase-like protein